MDRVDDLVAVSGTDIAILDQEVLGVLGKVRRGDDTEARCTIRFERGGVLLGKSEPPTVLPIELDEFRGDGVGVELRVGWVERDLGALNLANDVERGGVLPDTKGDGQLATSGIGVNCESGVARCNEDGSVGGKIRWSKIRGALQVSEYSDDLVEVALSGRRVMSTCHDDSQLDVGADLE